MNIFIKMKLFFSISVYIIINIIYSANTAVAQPLSFVEHMTKDSYGNEVIYYLSAPKPNAPLVVMIQGSGCKPLFIRKDGHIVASTYYGAVTLAERGDISVLLVEKPFAEFVHFAEEGTAIGCSKSFNEYFTAEHWTASIIAAMKAARTSEGISPSRTLVLGGSEGAVVAGLVTARVPYVTHMAGLGASGVTQAYDFIVNAYRSSADDETRVKSIQNIEGAINNIESDPNSSSRFMWGHPFKRWSSFFNVSLASELKKSSARIYLVSGMDDNNVPILSTEVAASELLVAGHRVIFERIPGAGHGLMRSGDHLEAIQNVYDRIVRWFLND